MTEEKTLDKIRKNSLAFIPLILIVTIAFLLITIAIIGDLYSYWSISKYNYQSNGLYESDNSLRF